jgi:hypothetical protein
LTQWLEGSSLVCFIPTALFSFLFAASQPKFSCLNFSCISGTKNRYSFLDFEKKRGAEMSAITRDVFSKVVDAGFDFSFEGTTLAVMIIQKWLK